jgi:predicted membrane channel-forming protein YqfA (hemolysin III family)
MFTKTDIEQYFFAFKNEQLFLIILGAVALVIAVVFYAGLKTNWYKGFALPLAVFALLNMGAGFSNYGKADILKARNLYNYDLHPELLRTKELPRIIEMNQNLNLLIYVNISIIFAAAFIFFYFKKKEGNEYYMGVAASLFLVAVLSVFMYSIIKGNSKNYEKGIIDYTKNIIPS